MRCEQNISCLTINFKPLPSSYTDKSQLYGAVSKGDWKSLEIATREPPKKTKADVSIILLFNLHMYYLKIYKFI